MDSQARCYWLQHITKDPTSECHPHLFMDSWFWKSLGQRPEVLLIIEKALPPPCFSQGGTQRRTPLMIQGMSHSSQQKMVLLILCSLAVKGVKPVSNQHLQLGPEMNQCGCNSPRESTSWDPEATLAPLCSSCSFWTFFKGSPT